MKSYLKVSIILFLLATAAAAGSAYQDNEWAGNEKMAAESGNCWYDPDHDVRHCPVAYRCEECNLLFTVETDEGEVRCPVCGSVSVAEE